MGGRELGCSLAGKGRSRPGPWPRPRRALSGGGPAGGGASLPALGRPPHLSCVRTPRERPRGGPAETEPPGLATRPSTAPAPAPTQGGRSHPRNPERCLAPAGGRCLTQLSQWVPLQSSVLPTQCACQSPPGGQPAIPTPPPHPWSQWPPPACLWPVRFPIASCRPASWAWPRCP